VPFARPSLQALRERGRAAFAARLGGPGGLPRHSNLRVLADVMAGLMHEQYGFLDRVARQILPDTAEGPYLERQAAVWGLARKPPAFAAGPVAFAGADGAAVPAGTALHAADGRAYRVVDGVTLAGGTGTATVEAAEPGAAGNRAAGAALGLSVALAGVEAQATVGAGGLAGGADAEADESLRDRLLYRIRRPPHGGAAGDYRAWALEVPGVTRVWVRAGALGPGTVVVYVAMDDAYPDGIPQGTAGPAGHTGDLAAVFDHIEPLRPVTAEVTVLAPTPRPLALTIADLEPDTPETRAAVAAEVADLIRRKGEPGGTIRVSWLWEAVSVAAGERSHRIVAPAGDVAHAPAELPVPGAVAYA